ncbi:MAG: acyl-CoA dehydrogenase [Arenicella sp.]|jgi:acyl-CoA dehydrogenase
MSDLETFRLETHAWLDANCPRSQRQPVKTAELINPGSKQVFPSEDAKLWFKRMRDKGWTCPDFPKQYGGAGLDVAQEKVLRDEMKRLNCRSPLTDSGVSMLGPALLEFGSDEQKAEHLPKICAGLVRWCQGYSEPGAGSDLASLQCKAEDQGDNFVVNGTKIWTSFGVESDWIFCLVRTSNEGSKQQGISFLLVDMKSLGVKVEPIELISGESEFAQVFFDDVVVPKENLVSELNKGWTVAKALLKHERKMISSLGIDVMGGNISMPAVAKEHIGCNDQGQIANPLVRDAITQHEMTMRAISLTGYRTHQEALTNKMDPHVPLIMKYLGTSELQRKDELLVDMLGSRGLGWQDDQFSELELRAGRELLFNKAMTIAGGTNEIQLNIIAKRVLSLPEA